MERSRNPRNGDRSARSSPPERLLPGAAGTSPRLAAALALAQVDRGGLIDDALATWEAAHAASDPRDRALARELASGAVIWARLYDHLCDRFLRPGPQSPGLRHVLRIGCHQLFACERIPVHAAVAATVECLRPLHQAKLVPVANAVLRQVSTLFHDDLDDDPPIGRIAPHARPDDLSVRHGLPALLVSDLRHLLDSDPARRLSDLNRRPPLSTRTKAGRSPPVGRSIVHRDGAWIWWDDPAEGLSWVRDGVCVVQDRAQGHVAELARSLAGARPGALVLDLCAAPGGKAAALAELGCQVIAADAAARRLATVDSQLSRLAQDGLFPALAEGACDVVVVDAPCSNSGVLGRRVEARLRYDRKHLEDLGRLQRGLLASAARLARPDGAIVYATCSLSPAENQAVAHDLAGWRLRGERLSWPDRWSSGGYVAVLVRS
ncbi:ribosomal RNA small subunit methyltransferase B [Planctomycetota bacterium]|nr:ribosomal RNA small subunit methyltransferase B [Planctomycetota bacterium]